MKNYSVMLNEIYESVEGMPSEECRLDCYIPTQSLDGTAVKKRRSVLICPGGGYNFVSGREGEPIALAFAARGYNAYVLDYSTQNKVRARFPVQLLQGWAAVRYIHENCGEHSGDPDAISVCGFSAGGHLAGSIGTLHGCDEVNAVFGKKRQYGVSRSVLCYPVISSENCPHSNSFTNLCGSTDPKIWRAQSLENRVDAATPPAFLWHTSDDNVVDVRNSLCYCSKLREYNIPFELHIYPRGVHGLSLASEITSNGNSGCVNPDCAEWIELADKFLRKPL